MQGQPRKYSKNYKVFHIFAGVIEFTNPLIYVDIKILSR